MPEVKKLVKTYKVRMICDKCGKGYMRPLGEVLTTFPLQYPHRCSACGHVENYTDTYPRMEYEEVDDDPGTG